MTVKSIMVKLMAISSALILVLQPSLVTSAKTSNAKLSHVAQRANLSYKNNQRGYNSSLKQELSTGGIISLFKYDKNVNSTLQNNISLTSMHPLLEASCPLYGNHRMVKYGTVDIYSGNSIHSTLRYAGWMLFKCKCGETFCCKSDAFMYTTAAIGYYLTGVTILAGNNEFSFAQSTDPVCYCNKNYMYGYTFKYELGITSSNA